MPRAPGCDLDVPRSCDSQINLCDIFNTIDLAGTAIISRQQIKNAIVELDHKEFMGVRAWLAGGHFIPGGASQRVGVVRLWRSLSHVVGPSLWFPG